MIHLHNERSPAFAAFDPFPDDKPDLTPHQMRERAISASKMLELAIRQEIDLASDEEIRAAAFAEVSDIAGRMGISRTVAGKLRCKARRKVMERWLDEDGMK